MSQSHATRPTSDLGFDPAQAAKAILPVLKSTAENSEKQRCVDPEAILALRNSGLSRMLAPTNIGGYELSPSAHIRSCRALAEGCSAASWVHMVCGAHTYVLGRYSPQCQEEVFDGNPDVLLPGTLAPQGLARQTQGGWVLNGRWQFASGVDHGDWILIGAKAVAKDGNSALLPVHVFVPKSDLTVLDTWHTLGMRGTGSKDLTAEDVFVPEHRAMATPSMFKGDFEGDAGPLYRLPVPGGLAAMLSATVLGIAERGLSQFIDATKIREDVYFGGGKAEKTGIQLRVAEACGELEVAALLVEKNCDIFDQAMAHHEPPMDLEQRVAIRWNAAYVAELSRRATERVFAIAGAHSIYNQSNLQSVYRDINTASHHAIIDFDGIAETRGKLELGLTAGIFGV